MSDDKIPVGDLSGYMIPKDLCRPTLVLGDGLFKDRSGYEGLPPGSVFDGLAQKLCFVCEQWRDANRGPQTCSATCMEADYPTAEEEQS
jgi:hypothetical protein